MNPAAELAFAEGLFSGKNLPSFETILLCRLCGAGFESWEGIAVLTPQTVIFSSSPGIFSPGKAITCGYDSIPLFSPRPQKMSLKLLLGGKLVNLSLETITDDLEDAWGTFACILQLRILNGIPTGSPLPSQPILPNDMKILKKLRETFAELHNFFPDSIQIGLWRAMCFLTADKPIEALDILEKMPGPIDSSRALLMSKAYFLNRNTAMTSALLDHFKKDVSDQIVRRFRILTAFTDRESAIQPQISFWPISTSFSDEQNWIGKYSAEFIFRPKNFSALKKLLEEKEGLLLDGWNSLQKSDFLKCEFWIGEYKKSFPADPFEIMRLEAALAHAREEYPMAFGMLNSSRSKDLLIPLLETAVLLEKEDCVASFLNSIEPRELSLQASLLALKIYVSVGKYDRCMEIHRSIESKISLLSEFSLMEFHLFGAKIFLSNNDCTSAKREIGKILAGFGLSRNFSNDTKSMGVTPSALLSRDFSVLFFDLFLTLAEIQLTEKQPIDALDSLGKIKHFVSGIANARMQNRFQQLMIRSQNQLKEFCFLPCSSAESTFISEQEPDIAGVYHASTILLDKILKNDISTATRNIMDKYNRISHDLNSPIVIAVMGEFNAGKSTLLNAIFGAELLPSGVRPTTCLPCRIRYGPQKFSQAVLANRQTIPLDNGDIRKILDENGLRVANKDKWFLQEISMMEMFFPHPVLENIWFLDTPGLNSGITRHQSYTEELVEVADAIIWVFDATQPGRASELQALRRLRREHQIVFPVINRIDEIDAAERSELILVFQELVKEFSDEVFPISAREILKQRSTPNTNSNCFESNVPFFEKLKKIFWKKNNTVKSANLKSRAIEQINKLHAIYENRILEARKTEADLEEVISTFQRQIRENEKTSLKSFINSLMTPFITDITDVYNKATTNKPTKNTDNTILGNYINIKSDKIIIDISHIFTSMLRDKTASIFKQWAACANSFVDNDIPENPRHPGVFRLSTPSVDDIPENPRHPGAFRVSTPSVDDMRSFTFKIIGYADVVLADISARIFAETSMFLNKEKVAMNFALPSFQNNFTERLTHGIEAIWNRYSNQYFDFCEKTNRLIIWFFVSQIGETEFGVLEPLKTIKDSFCFSNMYYPFKKA